MHAKKRFTGGVLFDYKARDMTGGDFVWSSEYMSRYLGHIEIAKCKIN